MCSSTVIQTGFITVLSDGLTTTVVMFQWDRQRRCSGIPFFCTCTASRTSGILGIRTMAVSWRATQTWWLSLSITGWVFLVSDNISTCVFCVFKFAWMNYNDSRRVNKSRMVRLIWRDNKLIQSSF